MFKLKQKLLIIKIVLNRFIVSIFYPRCRYSSRSSKIALIDHSYHTKTVSNDFIINYLKRYFHIDIILDDSWQSQQSLNLSNIDNSYFAVVFWHMIPDPLVLSRIKHNNLVFFPMYDCHGYYPQEFWEPYKHLHLKIISFSQTLHHNLQSWGLNSIYLQYFPQPLKFKLNKHHRVFFWQRVHNININIVEKLLGQFKTQIHFHKAIDPGYKIIPPTVQQTKKYSITSSTWFKTREEMQAKMQDCDIYIAPREYEGIGLSFLEAMAMGKAVIAANLPTMNEYITDQQTGYLYDPHHPEPINLSRLATVRKNVYQYITRGWRKWKKDKPKIIEFIKQV